MDKRGSRAGSGASRRGERAEVTIEKVIAGGQGLARLGDEAHGEVVLVPRVAPGERVAVEIDRSRKPARGRVLDILHASPGRILSGCAYSDRCGGCDLMHLDRATQRDVRLAMVRESLAAHVPPELVIEWHDATPERGRTRARWHAKGLGDGRTVVGYRALGSDSIVDLAPGADACVILDPRLAEALADARAILASARGDGEIHAALGASGRPVLGISWSADLPMTTYAEAERRTNQGRLAGVELHIRGANAPARMGDPRPATIARDGLPLVAPPRGFAQASEIGDRVLVDVVMRRAEPAGKIVVELFSGSGNFTVSLAREAAQVTAVELSPDACEAARANLRARSLAAKVVVADADSWPIPPGVEVVVLDPPRTGAKGAAAAIAKRKPRRVVYVSCDPPTLARDLEVLGKEYEARSLDAVDLFPETSHVELVCTLERRR